jgi:mRNA-degrading endonuclease RelE of RelBE toxin-antitoxin system
MAQVRVAFSDAFFGALTKLAPNLQAKVNMMVLKFQNDPKSPGLNYEKLNASKDPNMRSLRVDQTFRVIVSAPESGNVYLFLWVDNHDKAYEWAAKHKCTVNPNTGTVQLYASQIEIVPELSDTSSSEKSSPLFAGLKDRHLLKLGLPEEQLSVVRDVTSETQLDRLQSSLPVEAYEALFMILAGESYESIILDREVDEEVSYDVNDFSEALERIQSQARFVVPADDEELREMLNATIEKWRVFLHPSQRRLATGIKNGPVRVLGGAGTGKTVVAMHRAKWIADNVASETKKVLFTTFTKNLAIDIQSHLSTICTPESLSRIEVINLDRWVQNFLRKQSYDYELIYDDKTLNGYWSNAISEKPSDIDFPDSFFKEEWQRVIQPQGITSVDEYKKASRIGRGTRLNREQRVKSWTVFENYRYQLNRARQKEADDCYRDAGELIMTQGTDLPYCSIVVDEGQDMGTQAFILLRAMIPEEKNDIFIVGDAHQRIYGRNKVILGRCGINIVGRSSKLKINYRTTDEIRKWAVNLLEGRNIDDLDGGADDNQLYKSLTHGQPPLLEHFDTAEDQAEFIKALLEKTDLPFSHTCVVARTNREIQFIQTLLSALDIPTSIIKASEAESKDKAVLKLATIHRVKGLEFDQVVLASTNDGLIPLDIAMRNKGDESSTIEAETEERSLVYVAITRARKSALVLSYGIPSTFIKSSE